MPVISFPELEEKILKQWKEKNIFKKTLQKPAPKGNFVFFEGPPTANGKPGIHHVIGRVYKDIIPRLKTMQGFRVLRKSGWDTHGLPVELQIEKKLGISGKKQIESLKETPFESIKYFNELCKESVWEYKEDWEKLTERIAFWLDLEHPYITYTNEYIETLWWVLFEIWNKKDQRGQPMLYQGHKVVPFCTRCGTTLSSHEIAQGYKTITDTSVYVKFEVKDERTSAQEKTYILSWTTTPWTLPGNVALAVGPKMDYVKVKQGKEYYILSKNRLNIIDGKYEVVEELKGKDLVGKKYLPLFRIEQFQKPDKYQHLYEVVAADFVTDKDGAGIVHTAVMYGEEDYELGKKLGLPQEHTVLTDGKFGKNVLDAEAMDYKGAFVKSKEVDDKIVKFLDGTGRLYKTEMYEHEYPHCWRCDTPLLYYARDSWFIRMSSLQKDLMKNNKKINWNPEHIREGRFGEWLSSVKDWAISRERYWGTPLPLWKCEQCGHVQFMNGGKIEVGLKEIKKQLKEKKQPIDYHRPFLDEVTFPCSECKSPSKRVPEVLDVWFDSGAMPFAQWHYPYENKTIIDKREQFPADYIAEAIDQTRGWFYTLLAVSTVLGKGHPYKNVICYGHVLDKHGKKMSKSRGNVVDPWEIAKNYGTDALRFHFFSSSHPGDPKYFDVEDVKSVVKQKFFILWNVLSFYKLYAHEGLKPVKSTNILDRWAKAMMNNIIVQITDDLEAYKITEASRKVGELINEISTWYLRRSRQRFKSSVPATKNEAIQTLKYLLETLARLLAPFTPFLAEGLYQEIGGKKDSVHLEDWPGLQKLKKEEEGILENMNTVRQLVEEGLAQREKAGIKLRQPLARASIIPELEKEYATILAEELNVEKVETVKSLQNGAKIALDRKLTDDLKKKGMLRELCRQVNDLRKKMKLSIRDTITVTYETDENILKEIIKDYNEQLLQATISSLWKEGKAEHSLNVEGKKINLTFKK